MDFKGKMILTYSLHHIMLIINLIIDSKILKADTFSQALSRRSEKPRSSFKTREGKVK
jgi:hypothetical protein